MQTSGHWPTQLVVEFPPRLRATTPRIGRELALGAGTALALSALTVALGVVLTGLVVFTGSWPGFAPGPSGGEATPATAASRGPPPRAPPSPPPPPPAAPPARRSPPRRSPSRPSPRGPRRPCAAHTRPPTIAASTACGARRRRAGRRPPRPPLPRRPPRPPPRRPPRPLRRRSRPSR